MPPKKKAASEESDVPLSARFGRVKNTLKMGLVGLPNVGKSSLFNLLTQQSVAAEVRAEAEGRAGGAKRRLLIQKLLLISFRSSP